MLLWGLSWSNAKILGQYHPPTTIMFWRFLFATLTLIPFLFIIKFDRYKLKSEFPKLLIASIIFCLYNFFYFKGTQLGYAGIGGVLVTTLMPIITTLLSIFLYKKRIQLNIKIGILIGLVSAILLLRIWKYNLNDLINSGNIYFILGAIFWSILTLLTHSITKMIPSLIYSAFLFSISTVIILFSTPKSLDINFFQSSLYFWIHFISISIGAMAFGTVAYFYATQKLGATLASSFTFLVPVSAIFFSIILLNEIPDIISTIGCITAVLSVFIINKRT
tara:strand:+ start:110 stop:940 length:831 start_codon:yes stop_codon:yes gene_type:complete